MVFSLINKTLFNIFQEGSKTYFYSSLFFPSHLKKDVFALYGFVRKADNFVDSIPQNIQGFYAFKEKYEQAMNGFKTNDLVVDSFVQLAQRKRFEPEWIDAFLNSMETDIKKSTYETLDETINYMYGSAEVIGLFMAKIMDLPEEAMYHARHLGRSMQYINFIRDIAEDITLGRRYMPSDEMRSYGLYSLEEDEVKRIPEKFVGFIQKQLGYYCRWQQIAEGGYQYIPKQYLIPIKTASEMYNWTANQIHKNPFIIYNKQVKPMIKHIISTTLLNIIDPRKPNNPLQICPIPEHLTMMNVH